uniref:PR domain containing 2, with ZNF domain b n=1 Tax=Denticeps clupeoides TaxID=299321 RepID=A0AAY4F031_9TELE
MDVSGATLETLDDIPPHVWKGLPEDMMLRPSAVDGNRIGVWASRIIPKGKRFGPFIGERKKRSQVTSNVYMWEVYFPTRGWMCIDATDPMKGNWLRYVNWARSSQEQNLFPLEINRAIYYKVLRPIGAGEELLAWYNGEDDPEIAAALEEERASSSSRKSSPRAKRARRKLLEKARQAGLGGIWCPKQTGGPKHTEMRDSEEGVNEEDDRPASSLGLVQEIASAVHKDPKDFKSLPVEVEVNQGHTEQSCVQQISDHPTDMEKNEPPLRISTLDEGPVSPPCDTESASPALKTDIDAELDPEVDGDTLGQNYPCEHCERHFSTKQGLERHIHIHSTSQQTHIFKCCYCGKSFGSQVGRRRHERRHENVKKKPGSLAGTACLHSPVQAKDASSLDRVTSPLQNGGPSQSAEAQRRDATAETDRLIADENGEPKDLHICKYCNKAFGSHTNMRRHQRRIHERHLLPKGVRRKEMLLPETQTIQQGQPAALQEGSPSQSPPTVYVPSVDTEDEGERDDYMVDISSNISENLSLYIDGKILPTNTVSSCDVIEVDSSSAALFGLNPVIISPEQINQAFKSEIPSSAVKLVSSVNQAVGKRRTSTPPLLPNIKTESDVSLSSSSSVLVGNLLPQSTETLAFQKERNIYLSPKLKQLLQTQDSQKPAVSLIANSHRLAPPLSVTTLPGASGKYKRRTGSPPTSPQQNPGPDSENLRSESVAPFILKVPKLEKLSVSPTCSPSSHDEKDVLGKDSFKNWSASRSGGNSCNQQPLDLSNSIGQKSPSVSKGPGESVLDLSVHRQSTADLDGKGSLTLQSATKKRKPNTSMLEKVLMSEYAGLNPVGEEALGSPDTSASPASITGTCPTSPVSNSERLPPESAHPSPPSLTPMTLNPSSPCSSILASPTPPPPVLPTVPSPPTFPHYQQSDCPLLSPKMSPRPTEYEEVESSPSQPLSTHDVNSSRDPSPITEDSLSNSETLARLVSLTSESVLSLTAELETDSGGGPQCVGDLDCLSKKSQSASTDETRSQDLVPSERSVSDHSPHSPVSKPQNAECSVADPSGLSDQSFKLRQSLLKIEKEVWKVEEDQTPVSVVNSASNPPPQDNCSKEVETDQETFAKNFVCNVCQDLFHSIKELSCHIPLHAEEWPFKCEFCVQLFGNATALLEHRSSLHGVGRIFVCSVCSKEFAFLCNLQQHQRDLHPKQSCSHAVVENGKLRPQNYTNPAMADVETSPSNTASDPCAEESPQDSPMTNKDDGIRNEEEIEEQEDPTEELYTTIKIMASEAGKPRGPDVRLGINQHYPSFKPPPFPYHNRTPAGTVASATNFTTHNIPQTFSTAIRCTKCGNSFDNMPELHKHILACANASDKKRYTPKKNPIPLRQIVKPQNGLISPASGASSGQNAFRRMGQPKRLNFNQEATSKVKLNALKKKNQLVQRAIYHKNKSASSAKKVLIKKEEEQEVHVCPHCSREFTYPASLSKHIAVSCPMKPVPKKGKKGPPEVLASHDKNMNLRRRAAEAEIKQELDPGPKALGKTRARSSELLEGDASLTGKGKVGNSHMHAKRSASQALVTAPPMKKGKRSAGPSPTQPSVLTAEDAAERSSVKMQRMGRDPPPKKPAEMKAQLQPHPQAFSKKEERMRTRERVGGPVTRSLQMSCSVDPVEVKTEDLLLYCKWQSFESLQQLAWLFFCFFSFPFFTHFFLL